MTLEFNKGVNLLIGENNSGKTSVIDALRICLSYGNQRRDIWVRKDDFFIKNTSKATSIEFQLIFDIEGDIESGAVFYEMLSVEEDSQILKLSYRYTLTEDDKVRYTIWGGDHKGQIVPPEVLELINFEYLSALRDAVQSMRPTRGNILGRMFSKIESNKDKQEELANKVKESLTDDEDWKKLIDKGEKKVNEHLDKTSIIGKEQEISIDFFQYEFQSIVDYLKVRLPIAGTDKEYFDLWQNGLGYNNLIYTATILGDIKSKKEHESDTYVALLIEEPEAHLHPQLQNIFFKYLHTLKDTGFQTFITSHSPTITAKADLDSLIVLCNSDTVIKSFSLISSSLTSENKKFLHKFLDVTKSQLFFANGVIFVEGISEALLLPVFARMLGKEEPDKYDLTKNGIELVVVGGVSFKHFAPLFNADNDNYIKTRCSIISDDDRDEQGNISDTASKINEFEGNMIKVNLAEVTFEYELFISGENKDILFDIFSELHSRKAREYERITDPTELAKKCVETLKKNGTKSEFSNCIADRLNNDSGITQEFTIPEYIQKSIKWAVG